MHNTVALCRLALIALVPVVLASGIDLEVDVNPVNLFHVTPRVIQQSKRQVPATLDSATPTPAVFVPTESVFPSDLPSDLPSDPTKVVKNPKVIKNPKFKTASAVVGAASQTPKVVVPSFSTPVLVKSYQGATFFDDWLFETFTDPTHGNVVFQTQPEALAKGLAYVDSAGVAQMKIDSTTTLPSGTNRDSVRMSSLDTYGVGTLAILDLEHIPYGPGLWPAAWMVGPNWPYGGEIDVVEGVNYNDNNVGTLHTGPGCSKDNTAVQSGWSNLPLSCDSSPTGTGNGCGVVDSSAVSFGPGFAAVGGGVFAMRWSSTGIFMWHWQRSAIPADITSGSPDTTTWGTPWGSWPSTDCNPTTSFSDMRFVFDITLCGDWAGDQSVWETSGAPAKFATCASAVGTPSLFVNGTMSINYLSMYTVI